MQSFDIQFLESRFIIEPQENGSYRIMEGEESIGELIFEHNV